MKRACVMGSLVLDITPSLRGTDYRPITDLFVQGKVTELSNIAFYMGGCVGNTGLALHKLGVPTTLCGKVGRDFAGEAIELLLRGAQAPCRLIRMEDAPTTVSIAVTPPGLDKITLFLRGASQEYTSADVDDLEECDLFHFGYPVTMRSMYANDGEELLQMMRKVRATSATTSLDTALPRPDGEHGLVPWRTILERVLPWVDLFVPSYEECLFMLDREGYLDEWARADGGDIIGLLTEEKVRRIADAFLSMGAKVVLLKLGSRGAYLRTSSAEVLARGGRALADAAEDWADREIWIFPNRVEHIVSTTGAGDTSIAGFLATLLRGGNPVKALQVGTTAASLCIQSRDTTSLLTSYEAVEERSVGAERWADFALDPESWRYDAGRGIFVGARDSRF